MELSKIATGWALYLRAGEQTRNQIEKRLEICDTCEQKEQVPPVGQVILRMLKNDPKNMFRCGICKCPLAALASNVKPGCRLQKWKN